MGSVEYINNGNDIVFDIWSTYDGRSIYKLYCRKVSMIEIKNNLHENDEFFGAYVALLTINNSNGVVNPFISMESGDLFIRVECQGIELDKI